MTIVISPFVFGLIVLPFLHKIKLRFHKWVGIVPLVLFLTILKYKSSIINGNIVSEAYQWVPSFDVSLSFRLDGLSFIFALIITGIGFLVVIYSKKYMHSESAISRYFSYILLFMSSMLGVVLSNNLISLFVFWELTSISSYLLIGFWFYKEKSRYGAWKALLITAGGGLAMLAGFILMYTVTGSFEISQILSQKELIKSSPFYLTILVLTLIGSFTKSAQFPFHVWLPDAMEAPTPVSAYLHSATMVKAGIYLLARLNPVLGGSSYWFYMVTFTGILTMCYGSIMAIRQRDLKALLAFSTISQLGLITSLLGVSTETAVIGAVFHIINHAAFKGSLFMVTGIIDHEAGTRNLDELGGLGRKMPFTAVVALIGALAMAGIPPLNGFISKELFFEAVLVDGWAGYVLPALAVFGSIFTFIYSMIFVISPFLGTYKPKEKTVHEAPWGLLLSPMILGVTNLALGIYPKLVADIISKGAANILGKYVDAHLSLWHGFNVPLLMSLIVMSFGCLLFSRLNYVKHIIEKIQMKKINLNKLYDLFQTGIPKFAGFITEKQMTGFLRDYLVYILSFVFLSVGLTSLFFMELSIPNLNLERIDVYEYVVAAIMVVSSIFLLFTRKRLIAILILGVIGYMVSLFFVLEKAPDLALTQLIVETITLVLFLIAFPHLPEITEENSKRSTKIINAAVSILTGLTVTFLMVYSKAYKIYESVSSYYIDNSLLLGGGKNIVNVILVDFRGFDTMGEITVLGIAAFSVYALIKLRLGGRKYE